MPASSSQASASLKTLRAKVNNKKAPACSLRGGRGGAVVIRGHPGYIPGFPIRIWILLVKRIPPFAAENIELFAKSWRESAESVTPPKIELHLVS